MQRKSTADLSNDDWLEICQFLSPCDTFRLSQTNRFMYYHQFNLEQQCNSQVFFNLIERQVSDHLENSPYQKLWQFNDREKLWMERKIQNRKDWKNLLRVYLRLSYLELMKKGRRVDSEFLIYQPFGNITNEETVILDFKISVMKDPVLIHGYRDSDGNIKILNWERPNQNLQTEISLSVPTTSLSSFALLNMDRENLFESLVETWSNYDKTFHSVIRIQEFTIPKRVFKFQVEKSSQLCQSTRLNSLQNFPCKIQIYTSPFHVKCTFLPSTLFRHIPFYHDLFSLIINCWFIFNYFNNLENTFRHTRELLFLSFKHPYLEGHEMYQYAYSIGFLFLVILYGGVGLFAALLPGFVSAGLNIFMGKYLENWEYPETRELRSPWNLLAVFEFANIASGIASTGKLSYKLLLWADVWKNSILEYFNTWRKKKQE